MIRNHQAIAAFIADAHLTSSGSAWAGSTIRGDAEAAVLYFAQYCTENAIPGFGAGDLFDRSLNRSAVLEIAAKALQPFKDSGQLFYYIKGNHDPDNPPWLSFLPNTRHIDKTTVPLARGFSVWGLDYRPPAELAEALNDIPGDTSILMPHQAWAEWNRNPGAAQGHLSSVPRVSYVISGDDHVPRSDVITREDGSSFLAVSPGSSSLQAINEDPHKYFCVLLEDGTVEFVDIPSRPVVVSEVLEDAEQVFQWFSGVTELTDSAVREEMRRCKVESIPFKPLARVFYRPAASAQVRLMTKRYSSLAHFFPQACPVERDTSLDDLIEIPEGPVVGPRQLLSQVYAIDSVEYGIADRLFAEFESEGDLVAAVKREIDLLAQPQEVVDAVSNDDA